MKKKKKNSSCWSTSGKNTVTCYKIKKKKTEQDLLYKERSSKLGRGQNQKLEFAYLEPIGPNNLSNKSGSQFKVKNIKYDIAWTPSRYQVQAESILLLKQPGPLSSPKRGVGGTKTNKQTKPPLLIKSGSIPETLPSAQRRASKCLAWAFT